MIPIAGCLPITSDACRVVAEAGQCMEGSVERACRMALDAYDAGAWGFKVQLLRPETLVRPGAGKYWHDSLSTNDQFEAFTAAGLIDYGAWKAVKDFCDEIGIVFFATPFDLEAVDALEAMNVSCYKIASGDITYVQLLDAVAETGKPIFLSTGAALLSEVDTALTLIGERAPVVPFACTLKYPTPDAEARLIRIRQLGHATLRLHVGYSDHTLGTHTALGAALMGATVLEKHYTYAGASGPVADHGMALDPGRLREYVQYAELGVKWRGTDRFTDDVEFEARFGARRSCRAARDLPAGLVLTAADIAITRPGDGLAPAHLDSLVGTRLGRSLDAGEPFPGP